MACSARRRAPSPTGMMGLVEEGQQVMEEEEKKEDTAADLGPYRPPHSVSSARNFAQQPQAEGDRSAAGKDRSASQPSRSVAHVGRQDAGSG
jgi:hypothetical protein